MAKTELFLLFLLSISFALIDPPIEEVHDHNMDIAPNDVISTNVFNEPEQTPRLNDPTRFYYVKILALSPSVNKTINAKEENHPYLIWLVAEDHVRSITQINGKTEYDVPPLISHFTQDQFSWIPEEVPMSRPLYVVSSPTSDGGVELIYYASGIEMHPQISWLDTFPTVLEPPPEDDDDEGCSKTIITRTYGDFEVDEVTATYTLTGILNKEGDNYTFSNKTETQFLALSRPFPGPEQIPFKNSLTCNFLDFLGDFLLGGLVNLDCNDEALSHASPYAEGTYNLTVRNLTVVNPQVYVKLDANFHIPYHEDKLVCRETEDGCECTPSQDDDEISFPYSDSDVYEVQNDYNSIIPYSPSYLNLNANTSEDPVYYFSFLTTSKLYKYYSRMDGNVSAAYYIHNFSVVEDDFGTQHIEAHIINYSGLLPEDPEAANNYTGPHRLLITEQGAELRNPTEITTQKYNYSMVYTFKEVFYNLTSGWHYAYLDLYTWWGHLSPSSSIYARQTTGLLLGSAPRSGDNLSISCSLTEKEGTPVAGAPVNITFGSETQTVRTDSNGTCTALFHTNSTIGTVKAIYGGDDYYLPADAILMISGNPFNLGKDLVINNFLLLVLFSMLVLFAFMNIGSSAAIAAGGTAFMFKGFSFTGKGGTIKLFRVKKGKELAMSVAGAAAE